MFESFFVSALSGGGFATLTFAGIYAGGFETVGSQDFSFLALFNQAGWVVKFVMLLLVLSSLVSWAIAINKFFYFRLLNNRAKDFEETFWSGRTLEQLNEGLGKNPQDPMARVFSAAMREYDLSKTQSATDAGLLAGRERIDKVMNLVINREIAKGESGMTVLSIIASGAVFVGLFGTVWGIMNAFRAIAASQNTNLAVVAPGIAEALFATALGLIAAIPALIFYNIFSTQIDKYAGRLEGYADELSAILSRKIGQN